MGINAMLFTSSRSGHLFITLKPHHSRHLQFENMEQKCAPRTRHWSQVLSLVVGRRSKLAASLDVQRGKIKSIIFPRLWRWSHFANIIFFSFEQTLEEMIGQLACHRVVIGLGHLREVILERKKKLSWGQLVDAKRKNKLNENLFDDKYKKTNSTRTWLMTNVETTWLTRPIK